MNIHFGKEKHILYSEHSRGISREVKAMKIQLRRKPFKDDWTGNVKAPISSGLRHTRLICDKRARFIISFTAPRLQAIPGLSPQPSEPYVLETSLWGRHDELMHCSASLAFRAAWQREGLWPEGGSVMHPVSLLSRFKQGRQWHGETRQGLWQRLHSRISTCQKSRFVYQKHGGWGGHECKLPPGQEVLI